MEELDIKQRLHLLQKQIETTASLSDETKLDLLAAIDEVKLEVEVMKRFLAHVHPDFTHRYATLREAVIHEVNPEWSEPSATTKES
jgi:hypothetical protein